MQQRNQDELASIRDYYDYNTPCFLTYGAQRRTGTIHRPVWGEGVQDEAQALQTVHKLLYAEGRALLAGGVETLHTVDLGCGVGASLFYLADNLGVAFSGLGLTISPVQARLAQVEAARRNLTVQCAFLVGDFLAPPLAECYNLVFSIEAFAHTRDPVGYFQAAAHLLKPGGRLVLCDDFLTPGREGDAPSSGQLRWLDTFRLGWGVPGLWLPAEVKRLAVSVGLRPLEDRDLTTGLRLRAVPEPMLRLLAWGLWPIVRRNLYLRSVLGGLALQVCLAQGLVAYRYLVFERVGTVYSVEG